MSATSASHDLFASAAPPVHSLVDDAEGGVRWWRGAFAPEQVRAWFLCLQAHVPWQAQQRPMYDRVVEVPRLLASYALDAPADGRGGGCVREVLAALRASATRVPAVADLAGVAFDRVGLNFYRDGRDSVAMHHDTLRHLAPGAPIVIVSLGATRRMTLRAIDAAPGDPSIRVDLAAGDVLAMSHACQHTHLHGIPKTARPVGARISLAFRVGARTP